LLPLLSVASRPTAVHLQALPIVPQGLYNVIILKYWKKRFTVTCGYFLFINAFLNDGELLQIKRDTVKVLLAQ